MVRPFLIFFIFLSSTTFFKLAFLPRQLLLLLSFGSTILMLLVFIGNTIYEGRRGFKQNFNFEISLFLFATVLSMFGAKWGHGQGLLLSMWITQGMYFYLFYFLLHAFKVKPEELERLIIIMAIIYLVLFVAQYVLYPRQLFNSRVQEARGTIRIFVPGGIFAYLIFFNFLIKFFQSYSLKYGIFCFIYMIIPVLQGTRSSILSLMLAVLLVIIVSKQVKSKIGVLFLMGIGAVLIFFIFQDIFVNLMEVSQEQSAQEGDDIRVKSARFFLTDFYPNKINYIIGNGVGHMMSPYGLKIMYYKATFGFYQSDIGIVGVYTMYGVLVVLGIFLSIRKILLIDVETKYNYIKFWAAMIIIGAISGAPFTSPSMIVVILSAMYILDVSNYEKKLALLNDEE